jgi:hypothetical protein
VRGFSLSLGFRHSEGNQRPAELTEIRGIATHSIHLDIVLPLGAAVPAALALLLSHRLPPPFHDASMHHRMIIYYLLHRCISQSIR